MGRKSIAQKIIQGTDEAPESTEYVVCYDFREDQPVGRFYRNLHEIIEVLGGELVQYSVFYGSGRASAAVKELAEYYGAYVSVFRVEEDFV